MKQMSLSEMITYSTVLIRCEYTDGTQGSGTGFIMNLCQDKENNTCVPVLITNKHVANNSKKCVFEFCKSDNDGNPIDNESFCFTYTNQNWIMHPNPNVDLCCLPLAQALNELSKTKIKIFYIPLETSIIPTQSQLEELSAMEDVVMIGYPIGLSDTYNHKPILRRGTSATHIKNDYQGKKDFLVDMACFPGSSGSPIFIINQGSYTVGHTVNIASRIYLVGILYAGPQFSATGIITFANLPKVPTPVVNIPTNLGIAIKASEISEFEKIFNRTIGG